MNQTYSQDADYPKCVVKNNNWRFVCKCDCVQDSARIAQAMNLFQYIDQHEVSDGLIWANEAEKVLRSVAAELGDIEHTDCPCCYCQAALLVEANGVTESRKEPAGRAGLEAL